MFCLHAKSPGCLDQPHLLLAEMFHPVCGVWLLLWLPLLCSVLKVGFPASITGPTEEPATKTDPQAPPQRTEWEPLGWTQPSNLCSHTPPRLFFWYVVKFENHRRTLFSSMYLAVKRNPTLSSGGKPSFQLLLFKNCSCSSNHHCGPLLPSAAFLGTRLLLICNQNHCPVLEGVLLMELDTRSSKKGTLLCQTDRMCSTRFRFVHGLPKMCFFFLFFLLVTAFWLTGISRTLAHTSVSDVLKSIF